MTEPMFDQYKPRTKNGYMLDEIASALQKDIRRGNEKEALFWVLELFPRYAKYAWKRIGVISVEDIESANAITVINSMRDAFFFNNKDVKKAEDFKNRIFLTKAILFLCRENKSREADHAQFYIDQIVKKGELIPIPEYAFDCHTKQGRMKGMTKKQFVTDEQEGLEPKGRDDYFDKLDI